MVSLSRMESRVDGFKRAIGLKSSFRRTGAASWGNIMVGSFLGVLSGNYIFGEPLREYWEEQKQLEEAAAGGANNE